jgi:hypothetical protein
VPGTYDPNNYYMNGIFVAGKDSPFGRRIVANRYTNFGPRIDVAWDPFGKGKTAIRAATGAFFDAPVGNYYTQTKPPFNLVPTIFNTNLANPGGGALTPLPLGFSPTALDGKITTVWTWNFGIEHEILPRTKLGELRGQPRLPRAAASRHQPAAQPERRRFGRAHQRQCSAALSGLRRHHCLGVLLQLQISVYSVAGGPPVRQWVPGARGVHFQQDHHRRLRFDLLQPDGRLQLLVDAGLAGADVPHIFVVSYIWEIPAFRSAKGALGAALGGWSLSGITAVQAGQPLNIGISPDRSGKAASGQHPNITGPVSQAKTVDSWFETSIYSLPDLGSYGTLGLNAAGRAPGIFNFDMGIHKQFRLKEGLKLEFRSEFFNIFNHTQFSKVGTTFGSATFGRVTSARDARIGQIAAKLIW